MTADGYHPYRSYYNVGQVLTGDVRCTADVQGRAEVRLDERDVTEWDSGPDGIKQVVTVEGDVDGHLFENSWESWVTNPEN
jgi:hypothetical protein